MKNQAIGNLITKILIVLLAVAAVVVTVVLCIRANSDNRLIRKELQVEAGSTDFSAADFLRDDSLTARFTADSQYNLNKVGTYHLQLVVGEDRYSVVLHVVDTVKPVATTKPMLVALGTNLAPEQLLTKIEDATAVYAEYEKAPDTSKTGQQDVSILLTDGGGNMLRIATKIYVTETVNRVVYELGDPYPELSNFIGEDANAKFNPPLAELGIRTPNTYYLDVDIFDATYSVIMDAVDTVLPVAKPNTGIEIYPGGALPDARDMVVEVFDATELTFAYADKYAFDEPGEYSVVVSVTDLGGNQTLVVVPLRVLDTTEKDTDPPIITGAVNMTANIGSIITYAENITVFDAYDGKIDVRDPARFRVDSSAVRPNIAGVYPVKYTATDRAGNSTSVTVNIEIRHMPVEDATIYAYAGSVLSGIVSGSMSREDKIKAIFRYVYNATEGFSLDVTSDISDRYTRQGYYGFLGYANDSFSACSMMRLLLDTAGIDYKVVTRVSSDHAHWWLLVDFGNGWFHVDALQNGYVWTTDGKILKSDSEQAKDLEIGNIRFTYQMTDADLTTYTNLINTHRVGWNYYLFDTASFPRTPIRRDDGSYIPATYTLKYTAGVGGAISGMTTQTVAHGVSGSTVVAIPNYMYRFVRWDDGVTSPERSDAISGDKTFKAIFEFDPTAVTFYKLEYKAGEGGFISGTALQNLRENTEGSAVTAIANEGYRFVGWSDGKTTAVRSDVVTSHMTVTAIFEPIPTYTVEYLPSEGGSIEGYSSQTVPQGAQSSAVTAVAQAGYRFIGWSDGVTEATRSDVIISDLYVTALFEVDPAQDGRTVIYVDAGHGFANSYGAIDKGAGEGTAYTTLTGKYESDLNLAIALKVKQILLAKGYEVIMSREGEVNRYLTPTERAEAVNDTIADLFVSIHGNTYVDESVKGARVYYSSLNENASVCLGYANTMAAALNATSGASLKKVTVQDHPNIAVIRGVLVPTVLVETCYMTSPEDAAMAATDAWITTMAEAICLGITNQLAK